MVPGGAGTKPGLAAVQYFESQSTITLADKVLSLSNYASLLLFIWRFV